jgi:hypothetical protein
MVAAVICTKSKTAGQTLLLTGDCGPDHKNYPLGGVRRPVVSGPAPPGRHPEEGAVRIGLEVLEHPADLKVAVGLVGVAYRT